MYKPQGGVSFVQISSGECHFIHSLGWNLKKKKNPVRKVRHRFICHISKSQGEECHFVKSQGMVVYFTPCFWEVAVEIELSLML